MKKWRQKPDARCQWKPLITQQLICHLSAEEGHNDQPLLGSKEIFFDRLKVVVRNKKQLTPYPYVLVRYECI